MISETCSKYCDAQTECTSHKEEACSITDSSEADVVGHAQLSILLGPAVSWLNIESMATCSFSFSAHDNTVSDTCDSGCYTYSKATGECEANVSDALYSVTTLLYLTLLTSVSSVS